MGKRNKKMDVSEVQTGDEFVNEIRLQVRFCETDSAGIVHHSNIFHWLEMGRFDLMFKLFETDNDMRKMFFPVTKCKCAYISMARFNQELIVKTYFKRVKGTKLCFYYSVVDANKPKTVIAMAMTEHVCIVNQSRILIKWPKEIENRIQWITKQYPYVFVDGEIYEKKL